jgi:hypothetical protein
MKHEQDYTPEELAELQVIQDYNESLVDQAREDQFHNHMEYRA